MNHLFLIFLSIIGISFCDDESDGHITYYVYHSLEPSTVRPVYEQRGIITYFSNRNEAIYTEDSPLTSVKIEKLKNLAATDDIYRVKISSKPDDPESSTAFSFTKACAVYESGLSDTLTIALDQSGLPVGIAISASPPFCTASAVSEIKLLNFNTSVNIVPLVNAPAPDTLTYIQRLEQEKAEKARGEQGDNRSFLSKYWMYIVPFLIFVFISGASSPEGQGGGR
ncbi:ER membrane protein complex subunit 10 like protein [Argiope bruennichi]|uniref:ER membrane protein complex subunit 10 n=2 Tax=Argiope bruennichi TaxID=94029 RepID=A0A8T0E061_ARGBR|nr:ER membrane protein complex subunit 10 like protein [Argiope bruennichi]